MPERGLKLGQRVVAIEDPKPEARLIFENGASAAHALIVAADGVHSVARAALDLGHKPRLFGPGRLARAGAHGRPA